MKTRKCYDCGLLISDSDWNMFSFCPSCGRDFRKRQHSEIGEKYQTRQKNIFFNDGRECGLRVGDRSFQIDKRKFAELVPRFADWVKENPGKSFAVGLGAAAAGAGMVVAGSTIIAAGASIIARGKTVVTVAAFISGVGVVLGVLGKSPDMVINAIKCGIPVLVAGGALILGGLVLQGLGYVTFAGGITLATGGVALAVTGLAIAGSQLYKNMNGTIDVNTIEQATICQGIGTTAEELNRKARREGIEINERVPIYLMDLKNIQNNC